MKYFNDIIYKPSVTLNAIDLFLLNRTYIWAFALKIGKPFLFHEHLCKFQRHYNIEKTIEDDKLPNCTIFNLQKFVE